MKGCIYSKDMLCFAQEFNSSNCKDAALFLCYSNHVDAQKHQLSAPYKSTFFLLVPSDQFQPSI